MLQWIAVVAVVAALGAFVTHSHLRRELRVAARPWLIGLRIAALAILAMLALVPELRIGMGGDASSTWTIVDRSTSMQAGGAAARAEAAAPASTARTLELTDPSVLAPLLTRAAEAGARDVSVITDLRIADAPAALALADALGLAVQVRDVGSDEVRSAGIARIDVPPTGRAGESVVVSVGVFSTLPPGDSTAGELRARVVLELDGREVGRDSLVLPVPGAETAARFTATLPAEGGLAAWRARVELEGDAFAGDDARRAVTRVDPSSGIVALVSLRPDWEPRTLLPLLGEAAGLPARGWLRVGPDAWLEMGEGGVVDGATLTPLLSGARVLVVHGAGAGAGVPDAVRPALDRVPRRILIPGSAGLPGEWYPAPSQPARFAPLLAGLELAGIPPLASLEADLSGAGTGPERETALWLERPGGGRAPGLVLQDEPDVRRTVIVPAAGFHRWHARGGDGREAFRRLFGAVTGWLLALEPRVAEGAFGPVEPLVAAGEPVAWQAPRGTQDPGPFPVVWREARAGADPGLADPVLADPVRVDTVRIGPDGTATLPPLGDGVWEWTADTLATGRLVVDGATRDLRTPRALALAAGVRPRPGTATDAPAGRPWRTTPWPWLVVLALLSTEWVVRRRSGLR